MNQKNYPQMSKDHNPYDLENDKAHYEVFELLKKDKGVSIEKIINVVPRSKTKKMLKCKSLILGEIVEIVR